MNRQLSNSASNERIHIWGITRTNLGAIGGPGHATMNLHTLRKIRILDFDQ